MKKSKPFLLGLALGALGGAIGFWGARQGLKLPATAHWSKEQVLGLLALLPVAWLVAVGGTSWGTPWPGACRAFVCTGSR